MTILPGGVVWLRLKYGAQTVFFMKFRQCYSDLQTQLLWILCCMNGVPLSLGILYYYIYRFFMIRKILT